MSITIYAYYRFFDLRPYKTVKMNEHAKVVSVDKCPDSSWLPVKERTK